jgi:hypothetical protein
MADPVAARSRLLKTRTTDHAVIAPIIAIITSVVATIPLAMFYYHIRYRDRVEVS